MRLVSNAYDNNILESRLFSVDTVANIRSADSGHRGSLLVLNVSRLRTTASVLRCRVSYRLHQRGATVERESPARADGCIDGRRTDDAPVAVHVDVDERWTEEIVDTRDARAVVMCLDI